MSGLGFWDYFFAGTGVALGWHLVQMAFGFVAALLEEANRR
jgi:hypothetical protein